MEPPPFLKPCSVASARAPPQRCCCPALFVLCKHFRGFRSYVGHYLHGLRHGQGEALAEQQQQAQALLVLARGISFFWKSSQAAKAGSRDRYRRVRKQTCQKSSLRHVASRRLLRAPGADHGSDGGLGPGGHGPHVHSPARALLGRRVGKSPWVSDSFVLLGASLSGCRRSWLLGRNQLLSSETVVVK